MNNIPRALRKELAADPYYAVCARKGLHEHKCGGRITWEHALIYAGRQIQERWAIIPLCSKAHNVGRWQDCGDVDKSLNHWIALSRATDAEILSICKAKDYFLYRDFLNKKYGTYPQGTTDSRKFPHAGIAYPWLNDGTKRELSDPDITVDKLEKNLDRISRRFPQKSHLA